MNFKAWWDSIKYFRPVILIAVAAFFCELGFSTINISTLPVYLSVELHAVKWLGLILGLQTLCDTLSRPVLGALGDRIGRRWIIIAGPLLSAMTAAVTVYISIGVLFGFRIIDGFAAGAMWTSVFAETGDITDLKHRNAAMSIVNIAYIMALALGPLAGGLLDHYLRAHFPHTGQPAFLFSAAALITGSAVAYKVFRPKELMRPNNTGAGRGVPRLGFRMHDLLYTVKNFPEMMVLALLFYIGLGLILPLIKLYAIDRYHMTELSFGKVLAIEAMILAVIAVPLSKIGTRWGVRRAIGLGLIWIAGALWLLTYAGAIMLVFLSAGLIGLGFVVAMPAWLAFITEIAPGERKGEVLGVIGFSEGVGMLIGASLAGMLFSLQGFRIAGLAVTALNLPFFIAAVVMSITAVSSYWLVYGKKYGAKGTLSAMRDEKKEGGGGVTRDGGLPEG
jgi:MFS family permease